LFLRLASNPIRWRILGELSQSDRAVRELTGLLGEPQSLVSYHLGHLRKGELVRTRRSTADGRDAYYSIDWDRCRDLFESAGTALHPGLQPGPATPVRSAKVRRKVLFLCTGNGTRSQIAEALMGSLAPGSVEAASAGSHPKPIHPNAVRVLAARGIDISAKNSKHFDSLSQRRFDSVITLCDRVREVCPELPGPPETIHWSIPDPSLEGETAAASYPAFERTARELETRIQFFLAGIDNPTERSARAHG
jgi:protein-tyrosine-phosphatase